MSRRMAKMAMATLLGFSDELQKIANLSPAPATGVADVTKKVNSPAKPKLVAKVQPETETKAPLPDPLSSTKTLPPPPITGGN